MTAELSRSRLTCDRSELVARLLDDPGQQLVTVTAVAGFGKSGLLATMLDVPFWFVSYEYRAMAGTGRPELVRDLFDAAGRLLPAGWERADAREVANALFGASGPALLVVDDAHHLSTDAMDFLRAISENLPPDWRLVVASRTDLSLGPCQRVTAAELAFNHAETATVLERILGTVTMSLVTKVHRLTAGWPAMTVGVAEWVRAHLGADPTEAQNDLLDQVKAAVVDVLDAVDQRLLREVAWLPNLPPGLCAAIGLPELRVRLRPLADLGVLRRSRDRLSVHPLVAQALSPRSRPALYKRAADHFFEQDDYKSAIECVAALDDPQATAAFFTEHPPKPVVNGPVADAIATALAGLPDHVRTPEIERIEGRTRFAQGDWPGALRYMYRAAERTGQLEPRMAWRIAAIHRFLGEHNKALEVCQRTDLTGADPMDAAGVWAWTALAHVVREEPAQAREAATRALGFARECGDAGALASAHSAIGMLNDADCDQHHEAAADAAHRWGDLAHVVFVRANHARSLIVRGQYRAGLARLDDLVNLTTSAGVVNGALTASLYHRGFAKLGLGQLDGAADDFRAALYGYQRSGSRATARPLLGIAEVHRERGDLELAAARYGEVAQVAAGSGDRETHALALCGLARVRSTDQPELAAELVREALAESEGPIRIRAQLAAGWIALAARDAPGLATALDAAGAAAVGIGVDRCGLADVLELRAAAAADPNERARLLRQAADCWAAAGHRVGAARVAVALARTTGAAPPVLATVTAALRGYGVKEAADTGGLLAFVRPPGPGPLHIRTLGGFAVLRAGEPVPAQEWQSKKARDLVKILLARRGAAVARETLIDQLWPDQPPAKCANRLSVALSTVRAVFDPDRQFPAGHFLSADKFSFVLRNITVDLEAFLVAASEAMGAYHRNDPDAVRMLMLAEAIYTGEFLEEDRYEDWAVALREQLKAKYLALVRVLARAAHNTGDHEQAETYALRALERDAYDEEAHLILVRTLSAAGRHGQARQRYRSYVAKMHEIGVTPTAFD